MTSPETSASPPVSALVPAGSVHLAVAIIALVALLGAMAASSFAAVSGGERSGVLAFSDGIKAQTAITHASCTAGPGNAIAITLANVGGWSSLYLTASTPRPGQSGQAKVSLQGTGHRDNAYAIALWNWAKKAGAATTASVHITANGDAGSISVKLPLVTVDDSGSFPAVGIAFTWTRGTCAAST